jgi:hypothetical protein
MPWPSMVIRLLPQSWVTLTVCNHETKQYRVASIQYIAFITVYGTLQLWILKSLISPTMLVKV